MVCYYYPPVADVGSKRSVAFSKYFVKYGWRPFVLSVRNPDRYYCRVGDDQPPAGVETKYARSIANLSWILGKMNGALARVLRLFGRDLTDNVFEDLLCYPDRFMGWVPLATLKGAKLIQKHAIDVVYVSCSPFSGALVGVVLKKLTGRPLVLDFRDPFVTGLEFHFTLPRTRQRILKWFERLFVASADVLLVTSNETRAAYVKAYPGIAEKTFTIYNGFDPVALPEGRPEKFQKFTVVYTGQFYNFGLHHEVHTDHFFRALAHLRQAGTISPETFQFLFFGDEKQFIEQAAGEYGVADLVVARARVPYAQVLDNISRSHLMLLRIVKLMISTKLFEGIPLDVPFLATIPHGEVEGIIREYSPGSYVIGEDGSPEDVASAIEDAMAKHRCGEVAPNRVGEFLARFSREEQTRQVMRLIEDRLTPIQGTR